MITSWKEWNRQNSLDSYLMNIFLGKNKKGKPKTKWWRAKPFLGKCSLITLYYSYIHTYLNNAYLSWAKASSICHWPNLTKYKQDQSKKVPESTNACNSHSIFMHKVYNETAPAIFFELFQKVSFVSNRVF